MDNLGQVNESNNLDYPIQSSFVNYPFLHSKLKESLKITPNNMQTDFIIKKPFLKKKMNANSNPWLPYSITSNQKSHYSFPLQSPLPLQSPPPLQSPLPPPPPTIFQTTHLNSMLNIPQSRRLEEDRLIKHKPINKYSKNVNGIKNNNHPYLNKSINLPITPQNNKTEYNKRSTCFLKTLSSFESSSSSNYCNNCGKNGHGFYQCKNPITSYGVIIFRYEINPITNEKERQYLMIRRKDTISYIDFLRGKYSLFNRKYIKNLIKDMTEYEQNKIMTLTFDYLWYDLWKDNTADKGGQSFSQPDETCVIDSVVPEPSPSIEKKRIDYQFNENDKYSVKDKFNILQKGLCINNKSHFTIAEIVEELNEEREISNSEPWKEAEWGFCKGRRNYRESDYDCAVREMKEETGYSKENMSIVKNINMFEEIFIGSNFKCYKHKYYLMYMTYEDSLKTGEFEKSEVACIKWASFKECISLIRSYNIEKKKMITKVDESLNKYSVFM
jgi:8-oxo-dGTP pyrophosphatase MutT (NUDIX family)